MSKRQLQDFHKPHLIPERLLAPLSRKKPARILVNFMGDLGGSWVDPEQKVEILEAIRLKTKIAEYWEATLKEWVIGMTRECPQHTFIFLTKRPLAWLKWNPFPDNCWVGATCWDMKSEVEAIVYLSQVQAKVKWISYEPLYKHVVPVSSSYKEAGIKWVVIGAQTQPDKFPEISWVEKIVEACDKAHIPVFLKNNLYPLFAHPNGYPNAYQVPKWAHANHGINVLRQELPCR
jgi:protein gp37